MLSNITKLFSGFVLILLGMPLLLAGTPAPDGAHLYIISPKNGETLSGPVTVMFGLKGMGVAPAGIDKAKTGHHHLLINVDKMPAMDQPLPSDDRHRHFGGGQTEVTLELPKGEHSLQLVLGDMNHVPFNPPIISDKIMITVK
ncbi:rod shape-determining protein RodA [Candidatus Thiodiazotropha endoloripes]|nr:rod shape-determining protein RodA [Candidatus Thiodiazotropha endoloripes]